MGGTVRSEKSGNEPAGHILSRWNNIDNVYEVEISQTSKQMYATMACEKAR
jgi:hypothetical protein